MKAPEVHFTNYSQEQFVSKSLEVFNFQAEHNSVYSQFLDLLNIAPSEVNSIDKIPFLPIDFFKDFDVLSSSRQVEKIFRSSGTTGSTPSQHKIVDLSLYHRQLDESFAHFYGDFQDYIVFPLLPAYAERSGSSLIDMVDYWMTRTQQESKKYYLYNHAELAKDIVNAQQTDKQIILIGVSFALLDFSEAYSLDMQDAIVIETGGMKGRKKEMTRNELHSVLQNSLHAKGIQSEYGMTELLSQAYAKKDGLFETPPWMRILLRDPEDPLSYVPNGKSGGINVIDFANINSCAFIATDDLGRYHDCGKLEVLGRFDNSDVRGCNLMAL